MNINKLIEALKKNIFTVAFYIILGILVIIIGPIYAPDSFAHFDMLINRSVLYSIFLNIPHWLFGIKLGYPILLAQFAIYLISVNILISTLFKFFRLSRISRYALHIVFAYLAIFSYKVINLILSESIAYAILLIIISLSIKYYKTPKTKHIALLLVFSLLLLLTRIQFIVVVPFICFALLFRYKNILKSYLNIFLVAGILISPILSKLIEKLYYTSVLRENIEYSMKYVHLISAPFYVSDKSDAELFENHEDRAYFERTKQWLDNKNLNLDYGSNNTYDEFDYYQENFTKICNATIHEANMDYYEGLGFSFFEQHRKVSQITKNIFYPLLKKNFNNWLKLVLKGFKKGLHGSQGLLLLGMVLFGCSILFFNQKKELALLIFGLISLKLMLHFLIAISVHSIHRYLFYFDWVIPLFLILLIDSFVSNKEQNKMLVPHA